MFPPASAGTGGGMSSPGRMDRRGGHADVSSWAAVPGGQGRPNSTGMVKGEMSNGGSSGEEDPLRKRPRGWRCVPRCTWLRLRLHGILGRVAVKVDKSPVSRNFMSKAITVTCDQKLFSSDFGPFRGLEDS